ncbi:MAG: FlgD immunoglobulin-like domain containing protein, partial [Pseudomonadota bacterium]
PLEPIDSTDFVAQLAQFSSVEQQVATNDRLDAVLARLSGAGASDMAQWIGQEVRAPVALEFKGDPLELTISPDPRATTAALVVRDANGAIVSTFAVDPDANELIWDGTRSGGEMAEEGFYSFSVARWAGDEALEDDIPRGFTPVTEVRLDGEEHQLIVGSGESVGLEGVSAIRAAQSDPG